MNLNYKSSRDLLSMILDFKKLLELEKIINRNDNKVISLIDLDSCYQRLETRVDDYCAEYGADWEDIEEIIGMFGRMEKILMSTNARKGAV